jgi:cytochrome subunit of sulfide dehydrogenase
MKHMVGARALLALAFAGSASMPASAQVVALTLPPPGASSCGGCHAPPGGATTVPPLAGRSAADIVKLMAAFRNGSQPATVMDRIAKGFSETETEAIAAWYAGQK